MVFTTWKWKSNLFRPIFSMLWNASNPLNSKLSEFLIAKDIWEQGNWANKKSFSTCYHHLKHITTYIYWHTLKSRLIIKWETENGMRNEATRFVYAKKQIWKETSTNNYNMNFWPKIWNFTDFITNFVLWSDKPKKPFAENY